MPSFPDMRSGVGPVITPFSWASVGPWVGVAQAASSTPWPTANMAQFIPFRLLRPFTIRHFFVYNGSTVSGNFDVGVYSEEQNLLLSTGSTVQAGVSAIQRVAVAATMLLAGEYYLALAVSQATATFMVSTSGANGNNNALEVAGVVQMTSAFPLPAVAVFDTSFSMSYMRVFGISSRTF